MKFPFGYVKLRHVCIAAFSLVVPLLPLPCFADESLTVATWNVGFIDRDVSALDLDGFLNEVDFDILLVNEVETQDQLDDLKAAMGREEFFTAISSFENGNNNLEVGIISRFPLTNLVEFDQSPDNSSSLITERRLERVNLDGIADVGVERGFLVAEVPELDVFVIVSHFKSSRGQSGSRDFANARQRELVAAAVTSHVIELLNENPGHTVIFGGDVNVGVTDAGKNGVNLVDDVNDGYDETHALLGGELINGFSMRSLAQNVDSTFVGDDNIPDFPGTGAIDVLYISGVLADRFGDAEAASNSFGSDHRAVFATVGDNPNPTTGLAEITNALPDPEGPDIGREQVTLTYNGQGVLDISGWSIQDAAGNTYLFPTGSTLSQGENVFTLGGQRISLNNGGDTIILLNRDGVQQGSAFSYSRRDVVSGEQVRR